MVMAAPTLYLPQPFPAPFDANHQQYSADPLLTTQHTQYIGLSIHTCTPSITTVNTANRKQVPWNPIKQDLHQAEPIPMAVRFKARVCGRSIAGIVGIAGSNPAGDMHVCLLWMLCVVMYRSLHRADHSSRGVLPTVVCLSVIVKPR